MLLVRVASTSPVDIQHSTAAATLRQSCLIGTLRKRLFSCGFARGARSSGARIERQSEAERLLPCCAFGTLQSFRDLSGWRLFSSGGF